MAYISKEERKVDIKDPSGKWTDFTLLPEWGDDYYDVYTVRKHGKWVMLKVLKKEYAEQEKYRRMFEREFDTRYNIAHANVVMVNDFEEVPGLGYAIITDDVYGYSLRRLIDEKRLTPKIVHRLQTQFLDALDYIEENHITHYPITPERIVFTEYNENLKLIDVGYDQTDSLSPQDTAEDIRQYGKVLNEVLDNLPTSLPQLRKIANKCESNPPAYDSVTDVRLAMERRTSSQLFTYLCIFIAIMAALLIWLTVTI